MNTSERQAKIVDLLTRMAEPISARRLAARIGVSTPTIERDLSAIRRSGIPLVSAAGRAGGVHIARQPQQGDSPGNTDVPPGALVGRQQELDRLNDLWNRLRVDGLSIALISGDAGIGKSRLVSEFALTCAARGAAVAHGEPLPGFAPVPLWPWIRALEGVAANSTDDSPAREAREFLGGLRAELDGELAGLQLQGREFRLFERIATSITAAVVEPTLLVLDDLQDADATTLRLLEFVAASRLPAPLFVAAIHNTSRVVRRSQVSGTVAALARLSNVTRVRLRPLSDDDAGRMIRGESTRDLDDEIVSEIGSQAEGNPLYIRELVREINDSGADSAGRLPDGVMEVIGRRLDGLSDACLESLQVAALQGRTFRFDLLEDSIRLAHSSVFLGVTRDRTRELLDEAAAAGVVQLDVHATTGTFTHGLIHEAVLQGIPAAISVALHAAIATALEQRASPADPSQAAELALHFFRAIPALGPEPAVRYAMLAGRQAMAGFDYALAASHYEQLLGLGMANLGPDVYQEARGRLGQATGFTAPRSGKHAAVAMIAEAVDHFISTGNIDLAVEFALTEIMPIGHRPDGEEPGTMMSEIVASVMPHVEADDRSFGRLIARYATVLATERLEFDDAAAAANRAREIAAKLADTELDVLAERALLSIDFRKLPSSTGDFPARCRSLAAAAQRTADIESEVKGLYYLAQYLMGVGPLRDAARESERFLELAEKYRETGSLQQALGVAAYVALRRGQWDRALELESRGREISAVQPWSSFVVTAVKEATGDEDDVAHLRDNVISLNGDHTLVETAIVLLLNRPSDDVELVAAGESLLDWLAGTVYPHDLWPLVQLRALVSVARADRTAAESAYSDMERWGDFTSLSLGVHPARIRAIVDGFLDRPDDAARNLNFAIDYYAQNDAKPELARTLVDAYHLGCPVTLDATRLSRSEVLDRAHELATEFHMTYLLTRIAEMGPAAHRETPGGLSDRELEILRMVATGHSNGSIAGQLFITENTVTRHLTNIFSKIGVTNRTEATAFAFRNGVIPA